MSRLSLFVSAGALAISLGATASAQTTLFFEDFENGLGGWTTSGLWNDESASQVCASEALPFPSGSHVAWYGHPLRCDFEAGWTFDDYLTSTTEIVVPSDAPSVALTFSTFSEAEQSDEWDLRRPMVSLDGGPFQALPLVYNSPWRTARYDLSFAIGHTLRLRFHFNPVDGYGNHFLGWMIDDIRVETGAQPGTPFCVGDGTGPACPCANFGASGHGCATSFNAAGALLASAGTASVGADTLSITASGLSNASATLFQGPTSESFLFDAANGDGVMCITGSLVRIQSSLAQAGVAAYPNGGAPISVRGALPLAGGTRFYQARYRNAASYCTPATYNFTNGLIVTWTP